MQGYKKGQFIEGLKSTGTKALGAGKTLGSVRASL